MKLKDISYIFDDYIAYKKLKFYPVKMREYFNFTSLSTCLMMERALDPNPLVAISMSRLDYLMYSSSIEEINGEKRLSPYSPAAYFVGLIAITTKANENFEMSFVKDANGKTNFIIDGERYDSEDFEEIRKIIAEQNMVQLPNENIQKNVRDAMEEARQYKQKINGNKTASLEDQMIALAIYSGWDMDKIYNLTIRKFIKAIRRANHMIYQDAYLNASLSGFVEFKDKSIITGWISELEESEDDYSDVSMSLEELQNKANLKGGNN